MLLTGDAADRPSLRAGLKMSVSDWRVWYLSLVAIMEVAPCAANPRQRMPAGQTCRHAHGTLSP